MSKNERAALIVAVVALIVSGVTATISIVQAGRYSTSDYQATQAVKVDIARVLASLRSIMHKGALAASTKLDVDLSVEQAVLQDFLTNSTGYAFYAWTAEKSNAAADREEEWRLFFIYLVELVSSENPHAAARRAADIERLFDDLTPEDIRQIASYNQDISAGIADLAENREGNVIIKAFVSGQEDRAAEREPERLLKRFRYVKSLGISDADLDMWIAVLSGDTEGLRQALESGADVTVTDAAILARFEEELRGFEERRRQN